MSTFFRDFLHMIVKGKCCPHFLSFYPQKNPHPVDKDVDNFEMYIYLGKDRLLNVYLSVIVLID